MTDNISDRQPRPRRCRAARPPFQVPRPVRRGIAGALVALLVYHAVLPILAATPEARADGPALYLDSDGDQCKNKPSPSATHFTLVSAPPTGNAAKCKDSGVIKFSGGNAWAEVGTWTTTPAAGLLTALEPAHVWAGLKNSDDQGTQFDVRAEVLRGGAVVSTGLARCITGLTRDPSRARELIIPFDPFAPVAFNGGSDVLGLRVSTRIGTTPDEARCPGPGGSHASAVGLRVYYDGSQVPSRLGAALTSGGEPAPVFTSAPVTAAVTTILYSYPLAAQDPLARPVSFELAQGPAGMTLVPPGILRWIPADGQAGTHSVQVRARSSASAVTSQQFTITATQFNRNPTITSTPPTSARTGEDYAYQVVAFDPERQAISFGLGQPAPAGMTIDPSTGLVRWRPGSGAAGSYQISIVARDPLGGQDTQTYRLEVTDAAAALTITSPRGSFSVNVGQTLTLPLQASLPRAVFGVSPVPENLSTTPTSLAFTPAAAQEGTHTLAVTARVGDLAASSVITVSVSRPNRPPQIAPIAAQTVAEGGQLGFTVQATDPDGDPVTVSAPGLSLPGAVFNTFTRQFSFNPGTGQAGNYQVAFQASDGRATSQTTVAIQVTPGQAQQQVLDMTVDPPTNPTFAPTLRITGSTVGGPASVPPGASLPALVTGLSPASLRQGQSAVVQITGLNTQFAAGTSRASFGDGIAVTSFSVQSPTSALATVQVDTRAAIGVRQVQVSTAAGNVPSVVGLAVTKGTASVSGVVVDPLTGQPLANVVVTINGTTVSTVTDAQGRFTLVGVPPGPVTVLVTLPNYQVVRLGVVVGTNDAIELPDPIKINALARPPSPGGTLPRAATVASVLDRGIASPGTSMTVEAAKAAVSDTMIAVGGEQAGVLDESGNQLNPKLSGAGLISLTPVGIEMHARQLLLGQSYRIVDLLFAMRGAYGFVLKFPNDAEILHALQLAVQQAWADPDDPGSAMVIVMFSSGATRPVDPPRLTLETRLNSFQAFLFVSSFTAKYAADIDRGLTIIYQKNGLPPPQVGMLDPSSRPASGVAAGLGTVARVLGAASALLGPAVAMAQTPDETVAQRRLNEKISYIAAFKALTTISLWPDAIIGGTLALGLAWGMATTANIMLGSTKVEAAVAAVSTQLLYAAFVGAALAVFQKLAQTFGLHLDIQAMRPDPPIGESTNVLSDGTAEIVFFKSNLDTATRTPDGRTLYPEEPQTTIWTRFSRNVVADFQGIDQTKLSYEYRLFKVRSVDDENITGVAPLAIRAVPVTDASGQAVPNKLRFVVPKEFLQEEINYFKIAVYQIYDHLAVPPDKGQAYHYSDLINEFPSFLDQWSPWLTFLLSLSTNFSTPGFPIIPFTNLEVPGPDYLAPIFRQAKVQAAQAVIDSVKLDYASAMQDYIGLRRASTETDYLYTKGRVDQYEANLNQLRSDRSTLLSQRETTAAALERHANVVDLVAKNPTVSFVERNPVTQEIARILGVPELPPDTAQTLQQFSDYSQQTLKLSNLKDAQDLYSSRWVQFEAQLADLKLQKREAGQVTFDDVANLKIQGRPGFAIDGNNALVGEPTFGTDVTVRVAEPFRTTTPLGDVKVTVEPGVGVPLSIDELKAFDLERTTKLNNALNDARSNVRVLADRLRTASGASPADLDVLTQQLAENEIKGNAVAEELEAARLQHGTAQDNMNQVIADMQRQEAANTLDKAARVRSAMDTARDLEKFQARASGLSGLLSFLGIVYLWVDTERTLKLGAAILPSELSEAYIIKKARSTATGTTRIARDPLVPFGLLATVHEPYRAPDPGSRDQFPIKSGHIDALVYDDHAITTRATIIDELGFPSDFFAVATDGQIYANNNNSNSRFGGRTFRFARPTLEEGAAGGGPASFPSLIDPLPAGGAGVLRDFVGSINYYSLDAFRPPLPAEPIALAVGDYCCATSGVIETPFYADVDFNANPPAGRILRMPVEEKGITADTRLVGRPWAVSSDLKLETPSAMTPGHANHLPAGPITVRPLFLSDGPRIWVIRQAGTTDSGILSRLVETPGRQWAGLMVDRQGHLYALDAASGKIWLLPAAAVRAAIESPLTSVDAFEAAAFMIATGHAGALDLAGTLDDNGYFVADNDGTVVREKLPIVGTLPAGVTVTSLAVLDRFERRTPVIRYQVGTQQRFLARIDPAEVRRGSVTLVATVADVPRERVMRISLPLIGPFLWPADDLARKLTGQ